MTLAEKVSTTLPGRIESATGRGGTVTFLMDNKPDPVSWAQLHEEAIATAGALQALGVGPGSHVGLLGPTTRPLVTAVQAAWLAGATIVVLPLPMRLGSIDEFVNQTRTHKLRQAALRRCPVLGGEQTCWADGQTSQFDPNRASGFSIRPSPVARRAVWPRSTPSRACGRPLDGSASSNSNLRT